MTARFVTRCGPGLIALSYAALHQWVSKVGKLRRAARLLDGLPWH
jgi:hypothetical protein